jgi:hypothetical protein
MAIKRKLKRYFKVAFAINCMCMFAWMCADYTLTHKNTAESLVVVTRPTLEDTTPREYREHNLNLKDIPPVTIEDKITKAFGKDAKMAIAIAKAESGLRSDAIGDTNTKYSSIGIFQIRLLPERNITKEQMIDSDHNIEYAKMLFDKSGWNPWSAYRNGSYKKYLSTD